MRDIIQFFLDNPLALIVLIGVLSSVGGATRKKPKPPRRRPEPTSTEWKDPNAAPTPEPASSEDDLGRRIREMLAGREAEPQAEPEDPPFFDPTPIPTATFDPDPEPLAEPRQPAPLPPTPPPTRPRVRIAPAPRGASPGAGFETMGRDSVGEAGFEVSTMGGLVGTTLDQAGLPRASGHDAYVARIAGLDARDAMRALLVLGPPRALASYEEDPTRVWS